MTMGRTRTNLQVSLEITGARAWLACFAAFCVVLSYANKALLLLPDTLSFWALGFTVDHLPVAILVILLATKRLEPEEIGLTFNGMGPLVRQSAFVLVIFCSIVYLLRYPIWSAVSPFEYANLDSYGVSQVGREVRQALLFEALIVSSFMEEIVYRGVLFRLLTNSTAYICISSFLFAGAHFHQSLFSVVMNGLVGIAACLIYLRIRSVLPLALAHLALNLSLFFWQS